MGIGYFDAIAPDIGMRKGYIAQLSTAINN
jgi:hypothetical protein